MLSRLLPRFKLSRRQTVRAVLIGGVPLLALVVGSAIYLAGGRYVSTENAYVKAELASVSADVSGKVVEVRVHQHEAVQPGQVLLRLDEAPYRFALQMAEARLSDVRRQIEALRASYLAQRAALNTGEGNEGFLKREYDRKQALARRGLATQEQLDSAEHAWRTASLQAEAQRQEIKRVLAQLGGSPELPLESNPSYQEASAQRDQAAWNLSRTVLRASIAGVVGQEPPALGDYVRAGAPVFALVGRQPWVEANLKETELTYVAVGQRATITVDAYPGRRWEAEVISISPATGAEFSLLPPQNASGNWIKVVQRLPVRLRIQQQREAPALHSGMSVDVEIDTGLRRALPGLVQKALAWTRQGP
jgi:membrane fusion protein (multidrug efflux system)